MSVFSRLFTRERDSPKVLEADDLQSLAKYMKSESCRNVFLMVITSPSFHAFCGINAALYVVRCRYELPQSTETTY